MSGPGRRGGLLATIGYVLVLAFCSVLSLAGLGIGAVVAAAARFPGVAAELDAAASAGSRWSGAMLAAVPTSEPSSQLVLDYAWATNGTHTIKLVLAGPSSRPRFDIDAWVVGRER